MSNEEIKELKEKIIVLQNFHKVKDKKLKLFEEEREKHNKLIDKQKQEINRLEKNNEFLNKCNIELTSRISKSIHRIQILQMDNEVSIKDLGKIVRDLKGSDKE